jgi:hypothetical protein
VRDVTPTQQVPRIRKLPDKFIGSFSMWKYLYKLEYKSTGSRSHKLIQSVARSEKVGPRQAFRRSADRHRSILIGEAPRWKRCGARRIVARSAATAAVGWAFARLFFVPTKKSALPKRVLMPAIW